MKRFIHGTLITAALSLSLLGCETTGALHESLQDREEQKKAASLTNNVDTAKAVRALINTDGTVNMQALQKSLDAFDVENEQEPYFIATATGANNAQKWTLSFGKGAGSKAGSTYKRGIPNGFDALNIAIKALPANRTEKLKIRIDSDLYSGDDFSSDGSSLISSVANLYSIEAENYTILDFNGHTLYSENKDGNRIIPISLTKKKFISVRNLTIKGHARYAIWCQGCDNVVFDNIRLELDGKADSKNLGLRIAEKDATWTTNVFIDNIFATGCYDNAVETMKVDGILVGKVDAIDNNDCGLLLNTTTNAVVGIVNGTRCSPRASKGVYAAFRTANYVGPDVYVHQINAVECGRGYFSVSANYGISIDEFNADNCYAQAALLQDTQGIIIRSGTIKAGSNSGEIAIRMTNGSDGGSLETMNNIFRNISIEGYARAFVEDAGKSDYNTFINCSSTGSTFGKNSVTVERETFDDAVITIAPGTEAIPDGKFMNCKKITSIKIPASVKRIGKNAFYGCSSLKTIEFENDSLLEEIGNQAFDGTAVESVSFPASVRSFGSNIMSPLCRFVEIKSSSIKFMASSAFFNLDDESEIKVSAKNGCVEHKYTAPDVYGLQRLAKGTEKAQWYYWYGYTRSKIN